MTKLIVLTFSNGHQCEHTVVVENDGDWVQYVDNMTAEIMNPKNGFIMLSNPLGLHRVDEITATHFSDLETSVNSSQNGHESDDIRSNGLEASNGAEGILSALSH